ncbi:N,N-dimethylformamidase beta subunit family domain-containing protein [Dactylosporangium sp. CA-233914]|uniref:N,N-dimethylformamidase beta subunit family domain-containing protein n=1 Tax=Dactylosporangium sp. CA-233914 TaxID=3239934 RepID=UPI003D89C521
MPALPVRAYTDRLSYERGDEISVHVSAEGRVGVRLVRLRSSTTTDASLDLDVAWTGEGSYSTAPQATCVGSFLFGAPASAAPSASATASLGVFVWSGNVKAAGSQTLIALEDELSLQLRDGRAVLVDERAGNVLAETDVALANHEWHLVVGSVDTGGSRVFVIPVDPVRGISAQAQGPSPARRLDLRGAVTVAARSGRAVECSTDATTGLAEEHFSGKIEQPFVATTPMTAQDATELASGSRDIRSLDLVAAWDLALRHGEDVRVAAPIADDQPAGWLVNGPARAVTGRTFTGRCLDFTRVPDEYAAVHFHSTDLVDARWTAVLRTTLPQDLPSGVYGVVVENDSGTDTVPITVVPKATDRRARVAVILPTFTYLAYSNEALFNGLDYSAMTDQEVVVEPEDRAHVGDASFGLSMYDHHLDGSGVMFAAARRQIVNMRRGYRMWIVDAGRAFSSDMYLIEWLARRGIDVDVVTDHEVHLRGADYLAPYSAVISGSHPEYTTEEMLDALTSYRDHGGGLLYLGGNGWYWVTGVLSHDALVVEIRRGQSGVRCWESLPGEVTLMSTGLPGGLWRHRGRPPQELVGVGFAAQGWGRSEPYHRSEAAADPAYAWIFDGVDEEPIGAYGLVMGGAAGDEIDRAEPALGTPRGTVVLASSRGHSNFYQRAVEEIAMNLPEHGGGEQDPEVRADIVYFTTPGGGEVFSTGSIAWSGALLHNDTRNGVSRMTENVIRSFVARREQSSSPSTPD